MAVTQAPLQTQTMGLNRLHAEGMQLNTLSEVPRHHLPTSNQSPDLVPAALRKNLTPPCALRRSLCS